MSEAAREGIDIAIEATAWRALGPEGLDRLAAAIALARARAPLASRFAERAAGLDPRALEIAVRLTDDRRIAALNAAYRRRDEPTNVLSFAELDAAPGPFGVESLGDLALAHQTIEREAGSMGVAFEEHAIHLCVHGVLHLFGHEHERADDRARMEALESAILREFGCEDPWREEPAADAGSNDPPSAADDPGAR